jgi:hypothetical protein
MNWEVIARDWPRYGSEIRRHWPELRDEQVRSVAGRRAWLADCLQECYCLSRDLAESEIDAWIAAYGDTEGDAGAGPAEVDAGADEIVDGWSQCVLPSPSVRHSRH